MCALVALLVSEQRVRRNLPCVEHDDESGAALAVLGALRFVKLCEFLVELVATLSVQKRNKANAKININVCQTIRTPLQAHLLHALDHVCNIAGRNAECLHDRRPTNVGLDIINFP